jgi:hypothetical protein
VTYIITFSRDDYTAVDTKSPRRARGQRTGGQAGAKGLQVEPSNPPGLTIIPRRKANQPSPQKVEEPTQRLPPHRGIREGHLLPSHDQTRHGIHNASRTTRNTDGSPKSAPCTGTTPPTSPDLISPRSRVRLRGSDPTRTNRPLPRSRSPQLRGLRHLPTAVHRDHSPAILLGTTKGLLATAKFLRESGAFTATGRPYQPPQTPALPALDLSQNKIYDPMIISQVPSPYPLVHTSEPSHPFTSH